ncbi:polyprenyl synthetase family protein [Zavarzinia compransoris]|uniref:Farnesyl-diphosphate synthase n=1 Tax=Zavarzinia compransoris TaxID=1264899 RepID=A0A317E6E2_9PROT|nr:farnesyl diphosphate synthase [Zavarzinia compransoris]PWR21786.1 farnesyl-diphosphate synthase [Zavarzinia compransoris]TDP45414.1 farnesyl-diphosphate synthase [Zavarzinia compransoris]
MTDVALKPALSLTSALAAAAADIEKALDRLLPPAIGPEARLMEAMRYASLSGGKRLRPFLVLEAAGIFDVQRACAIRAATAVECVHCYSLVHDDLPAMDDDDLRRGKPTVHKAFDEATAVLAGDALLTFAFELLAAPETHDDPRVRLELVALLAQASGPHGMVGGQMADLAAESAEADFDLGAITRMQKMKTGALIQAAAEAGAILGKASQEARAALRAYAHDLGLAFQIADDLLDVEGRIEDTGKAVAKDAARGKATFVSILGVERARAQAERLVDQAIAHLALFGSRADRLSALARYVIERKS